MNKNNIKNKIQILMNNFNAKNFNVVISKILILKKKYPELLILYNILGASYQNIGDYEKARNTFNQGLKIDSENLSLLNNLGNTQKYLLEYKEAEQTYQKIIKLNPKYINAYINLANLKRDTNKLNDAIKLYEIADKISPDNYLIKYLLALSHQGLGNFDKSVEFSKKTLTLKPNFTQADHLLSQSIKYDKDNWHLKSLIEKLDYQFLNNEEKINLYFSLAKAYEDLNQFEMSFRYLNSGNNLNKLETKYNINEDIKLFEDIKKNFQDINIQHYSANNNSKIIFVVGMPRSGTSLIEQIISSHTNVLGGGELPILTDLIKKKFIIDNQLQSKEIENSLKNFDELKTLSNEYINFTNYFEPQGRFILDKSPLNFRWIGFIKIFFPNAKIIHCYRDPKNNCLSLYKNLFEKSLTFSYEEEDLINYYKLYLDLMSFWENDKNIKLINVNYETLILKGEPEIKRIIKECGLNWEEECLHHYNNKNPIKTMSTAQARKPIYKSSVNAFEKYSYYLKKIDKNL